MSYDRLRKSAFSHRLIAAGSMFAVVLAVAAAGVVTADPVSRKAADKATEKSNERYQLNYSMHRLEDGQINVRVQVVDNKTGKSMGAPAIVATKPGSRATVRFGESRDGYEQDILVTIEANGDSSGRMFMDVNENGRQIQRTTLDFPTPGFAVAQTFTGKPISLNLSNADIKDVVRVFAQLTGTNITVAPEVVGSVNVNATNVPWDQAFDQILRENGYAYRTKDGGIEVFKP